MRFAVLTGAAVVALCCATTDASAQAQKPLWEMTDLTAIPAVEYVLPAKSYGPSGPPPSNDHDSSSSDPLKFGESEMGSLGCIVGGTAGTAGALLIGGENIINLIAGGLVPVSSPAALYAAMGGVVFASFCAVGQAMTPVTVYLYRRYFGEPEPVPPSEPSSPPMVSRPPSPSNSSHISPSRFLKISETR